MQQQQMMRNFSSRPAAVPALRSQRLTIVSVAGKQRATKRAVANSTITPEFDPARAFQSEDEPGCSPGPKHDTTSFDPTLNYEQESSRFSTSNALARTQEPKRQLPDFAPDMEPLGIAYQSDATPTRIQDVVKTTGLHRAPLSGGVRTATLRYDLPSPPVAVRNLVEIARFGHLCTMMSGMHHRRAGYPFGTLIDFAADGAGYPIFCLSPLAIHSRNLLENAKCSLVVQMPGWMGLANARVTIFGDTHQLPADMQVAARDLFMAKHAEGGRERWLAGNFVYFRMNRITDIYFVGGFGTVQWIAPEEYLSSCPDDIVLDSPAKTMQMLNESFSKELMALMSLKTGEQVTEVLFISIDANGADIRVCTSNEFNVQRIGFPVRVRTAQEAMSRMRDIVTSMRDMADQPKDAAATLS